MGDVVLSWAVVILPTLFAVGLELIDENIRKDRRWKWGVIAFGVFLSVLTFYQQERSSRNAERDRQTAIEQTAEKVTKELAPQVAANTSKAVVGQLNKQYGNVIGNLYREIGSLESKQQGQSLLARRQLALNYAPRADMIYAGDQLQLYNRGNTNLYIWGDKYDNYPRDISQPVVIGPGDYYYLLANKLKSIILSKIGMNGQARVPLLVYISTENRKKYIMHLELWEVVKDGRLTIRTQNHGFEQRDWSTTQP